MASTTEKKKPGRPKKKIVSTPNEIIGILGAPICTDNSAELVCGNPTVFKKLFQMLRSFSVAEVEIRFNPDGVVFVAVDHLGKSMIYARVEGSLSNSYYCKTPQCILAKCDVMNKVFLSVTKTHCKVSFILQTETPGTLFIGVQDGEYEADDTYEIDVSVVSPSGVSGFFDDAGYPLKFSLSAKHFKSRIGNISKLSKVFTIQKHGSDPLQLTYEKAQKINWTGVYNNSSKIALSCDLLPAEIFNVSVAIDYIRPFSTAGIGETVNIAVHPQKNISFSSAMMIKATPSGPKPTVLVKVYTEIKNTSRG